jgi:hypothetical protein
MPRVKILSPLCMTLVHMMHLPDQIRSRNNLDLCISGGRRHKEELGSMEGKGAGGYC